MCNISVKVIDVPLGDKGYKVEKRFGLFEISKYYQKNQFFYKTEITISLRDKDNKRYSNSQVQTLALKAAGEAVGIKPIDDENVLVTTSDDLKVRNITEKDLEALNKLYHSESKFVK